MFLVALGNRKTETVERPIAWLKQFPNSQEKFSKKLTNRQTAR
jgi:hypothetical protein